MKKKHLVREKWKAQNGKGATVKTDTHVKHSQKLFIPLIHPECITIFYVRNDKSIPTTLCKSEYGINISLTLKGSWKKYPSEKFWETMLVNLKLQSSAAGLLLLLLQKKWAAERKALWQYWITSALRHCALNILQFDFLQPLKGN